MTLRATIAQRVEVLCQKLGTSLWQIQGVEQILAKYYAITFKLAGAPSEVEIEAEFEKNFVHTAGRLVGLIRKARGEADPLAQRLSMFVVERAWLVHQVRLRDYLTLKTEAGYQSVLTRISAIEVEADRLIETFHNLLVDHFVSLGTPLELILSEQMTAIREIYDE